jgi:tRNA(Ile)-lysidine synthase
MVPDQPIVARFADDLDRLILPTTKVGLAVSGGPDSLALLLLANAARPGMVEAVTVDHSLRPESAAEAAFVSTICVELGVPHRILTVTWPGKPETAVQEQARAHRYRLIGEWLRERGLTAACTGHHRDDQAETLLMRLARGSGVRGLAGMRADAPLPGANDLRLLRPLLGWTRDELGGICKAAGVAPVVDPNNDDRSFERVRVRRAMAELDLDAGAVARSAGNLSAADTAIDWAVAREWQENVSLTPGGLAYRPGDAPAEIRRRIVTRIVAELASEGPADLRGRDLDRLIDALESGATSTLRGVKASGGETWSFGPAPQRTLGCG